MFYEYALEPTVLATWDRVRYFLDAFGPWKGRFLAEYPRHWRRMVYEALRCPDHEKKKIEARLAALDARVLSPRRDGPYDLGKPWLENALIEHAREAFHAIIAAHSSGESFVLEGDSVDESNPLWRTEPGRILPREPLVFAKVLSLLLRASSRIAIIDPYFRADQFEKAEPLVAFLRLVRGRPIRIELHTSDAKLSYTEAVRIARRALPKLLPPAMAVTLRCWKERTGGARFHNRYILTDVGGVQFGDSIEHGEAGEEDRLSIVGDDERRLLWDLFYGGTPGFDLAGAAITVTT
jgi:hypothetical protein